MLKEALQLLLSEGEKHVAHKLARKVDLPTNGRTYWVEHNGELKEHESPPSLRSHTVSTVADLIAASARYDAEPVIWIGRDKVVLLPDDGDRRDVITLPLTVSATFKRLCALAGSPAITQVELIRLLRIEFRSAIRQAEILSAVRKIKFRSAVSGQSDVQHGNESLGRTIEAEVTGAGDIPESLVVNTNVYSNADLQEHVMGVGLDLEIDAQKQVFYLRPIPDEIEIAYAATLKLIRERIEGESEAAVFYGTP